MNTNGHLHIPHDMLDDAMREHTGGNEIVKAIMTVDDTGARHTAVAIHGCISMLNGAGMELVVVTDMASMLLGSIEKHTPTRWTRWRVRRAKRAADRAFDALAKLGIKDGSIQ